MGHCEMGLAVVGLKDSEIADQSKQLASGDWSKFSPAYQAAFGFARKQAKEPWKITSEDLKELEKHAGKEQMWNIIWWSARCHYMTRVADAFQFPLERDNVFLNPFGKEKK
jgi:hypothetical protein